IVAIGESTLRNGLHASRTDTAVTVSFDTPETRTRIADKFERFVRETLPMIYGAAAETALAKLPIGAIARQGNLVQELPIRGVRIPVSDAMTMVVYPETRAGRDGPLVVRYRVCVVRGRGDQH